MGGFAAQREANYTAGVVLGCLLLAAENPVPVSVMNIVRAVKVMICVTMIAVGDL